MQPYHALTRLSLASGRDVAPGELVELPDETAAILLAQGAVMAAPLIHVAEAMAAAGVTAGQLAAALPAPPTPPAPRRRRRSS